jgi:hypothetical protein
MKMTLIAVALLAVSCGGSHGKMRTDTPVLAYQKPDISEITGIPEPESDEEAPPKGTSIGAPATPPSISDAPNKSSSATKPTVPPSASPKK